MGVTVAVPGEPSVVEARSFPLKCMSRPFLGGIRMCAAENQVLT